MYVALHEVTWSMVVWCTQNLHRDGCSFMWHQPNATAVSTPPADIQKTCYNYYFLKREKKKINKKTNKQSLM